VIYTSTVTTLSGTEEAAPLRTPMVCTRGVVFRVEVYFPPGSSGLVGVQIRVAEHQLYPVQREEWFIGDNVLIAFDDMYELSNENATFDIRTYNVDTDYDHLVQVRIGIMSHEEFYLRYGVGASVADLQSTLAIIQEQTGSVSPLTTEEALGMI